MMQRLRRAWRALVEEPRPMQSGSQIAVPVLPGWVYAAYVAEARAQCREVSDIMYHALCSQARIIIRVSANAPQKGTR
jgi:hypothetical protein